ncbi:MAG: hypothetical protein WAN51_00020 [Alphaproteobacteria bacterium]
MSHLEEASLSELRVVDPWSSAALGTLLQMGVKESVEVGVRCNFKAANGTVDGIVIVTGKNVGKLVTDAYLQGPAFDVSELLEIVAKEPGSLPPIMGGPKPGMLFRYEGGYFIWFNALEGHGSGFICIARETGRELIGEHIQSLAAEGRVSIAQMTNVRRRQKSN